MNSGIFYWFVEVGDDDNNNKKKKNNINYIILIIFILSKPELTSLHPDKASQFLYTLYTVHFVKQFTFTY